MLDEPKIFLRDNLLNEGILVVRIRLAENSCRIIEKYSLLRPLSEKTLEISFICVAESFLSLGV